MAGLANNGELINGVIHCASRTTPILQWVHHSTSTNPIPIDLVRLPLPKRFPILGAFISDKSLCVFAPAQVN